MDKSYFLNRSLGDIVTEDFRSASVFSQAGIDFCCGGKKSLGEACSEKAIDPLPIVSRLGELQTVPPRPGTELQRMASQLPRRLYSKHPS